MILQHNGLPAGCVGCDGQGMMIMHGHILRLRTEVQDEQDAVIINGYVAGDDHVQLDAAQHIRRDVGQRLPAGCCMGRVVGPDVCLGGACRMGAGHH